MKKVFWYLSFLVVLILAITSCKKQEIIEPVVTFKSPSVGDSAAPGSVVLLSAVITDEDEIFGIQSYIKGPDGTTVDTIPVRIENGQKRFEFKYIYNNFPDINQRGRFVWHILVDNKFQKFHFTRSIVFSDGVNQVNDIIPGVLWFDESKYSSGSYVTETKYYDFDRNIRSIVSVPAAIEEAENLGQTYFFNGNGKFYFKRMESVDPVEITDLSGHDLIKYYSTEDNMFIATRHASFNTYMFSKSGSLDRVFTNSFGPASCLYKLGDILYTSEVNNSGSGYKIVAYNIRTGSELFNISMPYEVHGFYSFGDGNRLYFFTRDPNSSNRLAYWYYNKSINSLNQIRSMQSNLTVVPHENGMEFKSNGKVTKVWILTNNGMVEVNEADQVRSVSLNIRSLTYYRVNVFDYSQSQAKIIFSEKSVFRQVVYDIANDRATEERLSFVSNSAPAIILD